jgi:enoyl reductase
MMHSALAVMLVGAVTMGPAATTDDPPVSHYRHGAQAGVGVHGVRYSGDTGGDNPLSPSGPPPCWYVPGEGGPQFWSRLHRANYQSTGTTIDPGADVDKHRHDTKGKWWFPDGMPGATGDACRSSLAPEVWVPEGDPPPPQHVTAAQLAMAARAVLLLVPPHTQVNPAPPKRSYVGLATWVWAAPEKKIRQVTASIPALALSATVTATRGGLQLSPGTGDGTRYELHPPGGMCPGVGRPYTGATQTPPCGVTYQRSSADLPNRGYTLTASFTWTVTWTGSDGTGGTMEPGTYGDDVNIPVGEVQSTTGH